ncbi:MAG TPA: LUD domain-containing protein, partial [Acidimicrobiales bacterium]|nr:LUD domain-containing protein [Acidimicrobiales bacterium]
GVELLGGRDAVLGSLRRALAATPIAAVEVIRGYQRAGSCEAGAEALLERFVERVGHYRAVVATVGTAEVGDAVAAALGRDGELSLLVPGEGIDPSWLAPAVAAGVEVLTDDGALGNDTLDRTAAVLTTAELGIAETGTIVLAGGGSQGRRAISLVPDHHVVVLSSDRIVAAVPDAVGALEAFGTQTWISGPSATSDIELQRVEGVHGPRRLDVIVVLPGEHGPDGATATAKA